MLCRLCKTVVPLLPCVLLLQRCRRDCRLPGAHFMSRYINSKSLLEQAPKQDGCRNKARRLMGTGHIQCVYIRVRCIPPATGRNNVIWRGNHDHKKICLVARYIIRQWCQRPEQQGSLVAMRLSCAAGATAHRTARSSAPAGRACTAWVLWLHLHTSAHGVDLRCEANGVTAV
jgi:hypothetical protein